MTRYTAEDFIIIISPDEESNENKFLKTPVPDDVTDSAFIGNDATGGSPYGWKNPWSNVLLKNEETVPVPLEENATPTPKGELHLKDCGEPLESNKGKTKKQKTKKARRSIPGNENDICPNNQKDEASKLEELVSEKNKETNLSVLEDKDLSPNVQGDDASKIEELVLKRSKECTPNDRELLKEVEDVCETEVLQNGTGTGDKIDNKYKPSNSKEKSNAEGTGPSSPKLKSVPSPGSAKNGNWHNKSGLNGWKVNENKGGGTVGSSQVNLMGGNKGNENRGGGCGGNDMKSLYYADHIVCRSYFDASKTIEDAYRNICLSYPYIDGVTEGKRFVTYYRWIIWSFLVFCIFNNLPKLCLKWFKDERLGAFMDHVSSLKSKFDEESEKKMYSCAVRYMQAHTNMHRKFVLCFLLSHSIAFIVDLFTIYFYNYILQGQFMGLMNSEEVFNRNYEAFNDHLSTIFPPFVNCTLNTHHRIIGKRIEEFGCHLTYMEVYEKFFVFLWFWLMILSAWGALHLLYIFIIFVYTKCDCFLVGSCRPSKHLQRCKQIIISKLGIGDLYVMYLLKEILGECMFHQLVIELSEHFYPETENALFCSYDNDVAEEGVCSSALATPVKQCARFENSFNQQRHVRNRKPKS